ncbi:rhodanese-like domain-containing protein [bacterium]|nr:rhodanese-like domain-containing protein [bacterium]
MRICATCSTPTVRDTVSAQQAYFTRFYPREPSPFVPRGHHLVSLRLVGLRPDALVFYFAARGIERLDEAIVDRDVAYGRLENSGVVRTDAAGTAVFVLRCPVVYRVENDKIFPRHVHFVYRDGESWGKRLYTHRIDCPINKTTVRRFPGVLRIDARYASGADALPGAIAIPVSQQRIGRQQVRTRLGLSASAHPGEIPLIVYCSDEACSASERVIDRLAALGFVNTFWYRGGVRDWWSQRKIE